VVIILKPGKSDYTLAKAYHPISLLECCGKLLEKVVASRFSWKVDHLGLIGNHQFSSWHHYSAPDAALCLQYKASETIRHGRIGAVLLFDISRFFHHLDPRLTISTLRDLGVDDATTSWVYSFMTDRSPLSPILSALITSPLLHKSLKFEDSDLTLYIDDGCIYTSGPTFISALAKVTWTFETVLHLLKHLGLEPNMNKIEVMFFHPCVSHLHRECPDTVSISLGNGKTLTVKLSLSIRYLGIFFTPKLDWKLHVTTMVNHTQSTVKALGVLGSSVRGISLLS
jgi:hypothetical protein